MSYEDRFSGDVTTCSTPFTWNKAKKVFESGEEEDCKSSYELLKAKFEKALRQKRLNNALLAASKIYEFHQEEAYNPSFYALDVDQIALRLLETFVPLALVDGRCPGGWQV